MASALEIYQAYWKAEEALDLEGMLSFYRSDSDWETPNLNLKGSALRDRWTRYVSLGLRAKHKILRSADEGNRCFVEYHADITHPDGKVEVARGVTIIETDGSKITRMTAYFDPGK